MYRIDEPTLGIYEKALPPVKSWREKLSIAKEAGYTFVELSVDESDERLERLQWGARERSELREAIAETGVRIPSMCLSVHRRFPLGSENPQTRDRAFEIMRRAIELAVDVGIRNVQLAGYDVYYETGNAATRRNFVAALRRSIKWAARAEVMLSMEIMDHPFMNSIGRFMDLAEEIPSPWFTVYPDIGNLSAWGNDIERELSRGIDKITSVHLKDTKAVTGTFGGQFKEVPFGEGCVDFVEFFRIMANLDYSGPFVIEMWTEKAPDPVGEITHARQWILDKMTEGGFSIQ